MNISYPTCPKLISDSLASALGSTLASFAGIAGGGVQSSQAHGVYHITPRDLIQQQSLGNANLVAWRITFVAASRNIAGEVDVSLRPDNTELTSLNEGPFAVEPGAQLGVLTQPSRKGSFEIRILRIPEIWLMACWLHSDAFDLLIPLNPSPAGLIAGQEYSVKGLAAAVSSAVQRLAPPISESDA